MWGPGQPNGDGDCAAYARYYDLAWDDFPCEDYEDVPYLAGFICEQDGSLTTQTTPESTTPGSTTSVSTTGSTILTEPTTTMELTSTTDQSTTAVPTTTTTNAQTTTAPLGMCLSIGSNDR